MPSRSRNYCSHGYVESSCAQCREPNRAALAASRMKEIRARLTELESDPAVTLETNGAEVDLLVNEYVALRADAASDITGSGRERRERELAVIQRAAADPANREDGWDSGGTESAAGGGYRGHSGRRRDGDAIYRTRSPWQDLDGREWQTGSMVSRAHDCLDAFADDVVSRAGRERIAELLGAESDEQTAAARLAVALSDPAYRSAYRAVLTNPNGSQFWSPLERDAAARVNMLMRSATLGTGSLGWALPLDLDPAVRLTNGGSANPWRDLSTVKATTSSFWRGLTSAGATAQWVGEAAAATDGTPTVVNMDITPIKAMAWLFGSYESIGWTQGGGGGDVDFASNLSTYLDDAKDALEVAAFTTGATGTGQPTGLLTSIGTGTDLALGTGAWTMSGVAALKEGVSPRFRLARTARTAWLANLVYLDKALQIPQFSGALTALVDSTGPIPRMLQAPMYECSAMATATGTGSRVLLYGDFSQNYIIDRWPGFTLFEPMIKGTGAAAQLPTGQAGWLYVWRVGMGQTTTTAWRVGKV